MATKPNVQMHPHHHHPHHNENGCQKGWEENLKRTNNKLKKVCANKDRFYKKYGNSSNWEGKLKKYWESLLVTEDRAKSVASDLLLFRDHTQKVCDNTGCSVKAVKILFCYVEELFICIDNLKEFLVDILADIDCLNDSELSTGSSIIRACIKDISDKLDEAIAKQQTVIKNIIKVLQTALLLHKSVCSQECGLIHNLHELYELFPQYKVAPPEIVKECHVEESCKATIEPVPVLPLNHDAFYIITKHQYEIAKDEKNEIGKIYEMWRAKCESVTSCKSSLEVAISTSKEVKECK